jgi:hypothetical protein
MLASEWLAAIQVAAERYFPGKALHFQVIRGTRVKVRIEIGEETFADLFFREETQRIDYTLIVANVRRYGMDNLAGWHEHPVSAPKAHIPIGEPTPDEALFRLKENL